MKYGNDEWETYLQIVPKGSKHSYSPSFFLNHVWKVAIDRVATENKDFSLEKDPKNRKKVQIAVATVPGKHALSIGLTRSAYYGSMPRWIHEKIISDLQVFDLVVITNEPHCALAAGYKQLLDSSGILDESIERSWKIFAINIGGGTTDFSVIEV